MYKLKYTGKEVDELLDKVVTSYKDTTDTNAEAEHILKGKTAVTTQGLIEGAMNDNGALVSVLSADTPDYIIPEGYHNGKGQISIIVEETTVTPSNIDIDVVPSEDNVLGKVTVTGDTNLLAGNIKSGVSIFGVTGTLEAGAVKTESSISVVPQQQSQTITPEDGCVFSQIIVEAIPENFIDTSDATAVSNDILLDKTAYVNGEKVTGTLVINNEGIDTSDATATEEKILSGETAYVNGIKLTGSMVNNEAVSGTISKKDDKYIIPDGYHDGKGTVSLSSSEQAKIVPENIKGGINLLGVDGKATIVDTEAAAGAITATKVMDGYVGWVNGSKVTGTVPDYSWNESITKSPKDLTYVNNEDGYATFRVVNSGYYSNGSTATRLRFDLAQQGVVAENIVSGKTILGIEGIASGGGITKIVGTSSVIAGTSNNTITISGSFTTPPTTIILESNSTYPMLGLLDEGGTAYTFYYNNSAYKGYLSSDNTLLTIYPPWASGLAVSYTAYIE